MNVHLVLGKHQQKLESKLEKEGQKDLTPGKELGVLTKGRPLVMLANTDSEYTDLVISKGHLKLPIRSPLIFTQSSFCLYET